tara:strand:+ start:64 stop:495 length:432 start_codon:yes stop_codon:yes gene_type:complete
LSLAISDASADPAAPRIPLEVFTTSERPVVALQSKSATNALSGYTVTAYEIDGLQFIERKLSLDLPIDRGQSEALAMQRLQRLEEPELRRMRGAAVGLAKAMQYGIDRTPAVVFDGEAVVYGMTDVPAAVEAFEAWQMERRKR